MPSDNLRDGSLQEETAQWLGAMLLSNPIEINPRMPPLEVAILARERPSLGGPQPGVGQEREQSVVAGLVEVPAPADRRHEAVELGIGQIPLAGHADSKRTPKEG